AAGITTRKLAAPRRIFDALRIPAHRGRTSFHSRSEPANPESRCDGFYLLAARGERDGQGIVRARDSSLVAAAESPVCGAELRCNSRRPGGERTLRARARRIHGSEIGRAHVELQSRSDLVCRLLLEKKKQKI